MAMTKPHRLALLLAVISIASCAARADDNLLTNPGFEQGAAGQLPTGWQVHGGKPPTLDRQWVTDAHTGDHAVLIIDEIGGERGGERRLVRGDPLGDERLEPVLVVDRTGAPGEVHARRP